MPVNGDATAEANETFSANISNVNGAALAGDHHHVSNLECANLFFVDRRDALRAALEARGRAGPWAGRPPRVDC